MSRSGFLASVLTLLLGTTVYGSGTAVGSEMAVTTQTPGIAATSQTGARPPDTPPMYGTVPTQGTRPGSASPPPYGSSLVLEPPPLPSVSTTPLDRTDAAATAAAVLTAYQNRDLNELAALSTPENSSMIGAIAQQGAAHPRYKSLFSGWRWKAVRDWGGRTGEVRYVNYPGGKVLPPRSMAWVAFGEVEGFDEIIVVALKRAGGKWEFEDIQSPAEEDFARADRNPIAPVAAPAVAPFSTPEDTVNTFFQGAAAQDVGLMRKCIATTATEELIEIGHLRVGDPGVQELKAAFGNGRVTGTQRSRDPDRATVHIIFMRGGREKEEQMDIVREDDGEWKIEDF